MVNLHEKLCPCPGILYSFQLVHILLMLLLSFPKSPSSLTYIYKGAIFIWNGEDYYRRVLD